MKRSLEKEIKSISKVLKLLSHPDRFTILLFILDNKLTVSELEHKIHIPQSTLSNHLATLRRSGIIKAKRKEKNVIYKISDTDTKKVIKKLMKIF